jgi:hypothetical protein
MVKWRPVSTGETNCIPIQEIEPFVLAGTSEISSDSRSHLTDVLQFVTSFWSAPLDCRYGYVRIVLDCGVWNDGDLKRKRVLLRDSVNRMLQSETDVIYPVAWNNDASGMCVGMNLTTGEICTADIETGERDHLAASLSDFLGGLRCVDAYFSETVQSF